MGSPLETCSSRVLRYANCCGLRGVRCVRIASVGALFAG